MKKIVSILLSTALLCGTCQSIFAAETKSANVLDDGAFFYSFENESDLADIHMALDTDPAVTASEWVSGALNSRGALHVTTNGSITSGVSDTSIKAGGKYNMSMYIKSANISSLDSIQFFFQIGEGSGVTLYSDEACTTAIGADAVAWKYNMTSVAADKLTSVGDGWYKVDYTFECAQLFRDAQKAYAKKGDIIPVNSFFRVIGLSDYTIDDWCFMPVADTLPEDEDINASTPTLEPFVAADSFFYDFETKEQCANEALTMDDGSDKKTSSANARWELPGNFVCYVKGNINNQRGHMLEVEAGKEYTLSVDLYQITASNGNVNVILQIDQDKTKLYTDTTYTTEAEKYTEDQLYLWNAGTQNFTIDTEVNAWKSYSKTFSVPTQTRWNGRYVKPGDKVYCELIFRVMGTADYYADNFGFKPAVSDNVYCTKDADGFYYPFETAAELATSDFVLDNNGATYITPGAHESSGAINVVSNGTNTPLTAVNNVTVVPGEKYKMSMWVKLGSGYTESPNIDLLFPLDDTKLYSDANCTTETASSGTFLRGLLGMNLTAESGGTFASEWTKVTYEFEISPKAAWSKGYVKPGEALTLPMMMRITDPTGKQNYSIDDFRFKKLLTKSDASYFRAKNVSVSALSNKLNTGDKIALSYDFENLSTTPTTEGDSSIYLIYAVEGNEKVLLGSGAVDSKGSAEITADSTMYNKTLCFKVIPIDVNGAWGESGEYIWSGKVNTQIDKTFALNADLTAVDWSIALNEADTTGGNSKFDVIVATYAGNKIVACSAKKVVSNDEAFTGSLPVDGVDTAKMFIWDIDSLTPVAEKSIINLYDINESPFLDKDALNVVYLGGSITRGTGASSTDKSYASQVGQYLTANSGVATVNNYNAGIGGTDSNYGLLRLNKDVISHNPDMVFVEFAVNDGGRDTRQYMESIVRSLQAESNPYIVFIYTTTVGCKTPHEYHSEVAEHYGIPEIDLRGALKTYLLANENENESSFFTDGVHPSDKGHKFYADTINNYLATGRFYHKPIANDKLIAESGSVTDVFTPSTDASVARAGSWTTGTGFNNLSYVQTSDTSGASLTMNFSGNLLSIEHAISYNGGEYQVVVDDEPLAVVSSYYNTDSYQIGVGFTTYNLEDGNHKLEIIPTGTHHSSSKGYEVRIYNIITGTVNR